MAHEREVTGFEDVVHTCCMRERKYFKPTGDDPLGQICNECKMDKLEKEIIAALKGMSAWRRSRVFMEFM